MLSIRSILKPNLQKQVLKIVSVKYSDSKEPTEITSNEDHEDQKKVITDPSKAKGIHKVRKVQYDVPWPKNVGGEVQTQDSEKVEKIDVAIRNKGIGLWDIGDPDRPYKGHSNSAPYAIPTKAPPVGLSRLETWKEMKIESIPQIMNKSLEPTTGVGGKLMDSLADILSGTPEMLEQKTVIRENTDPRSIVRFPPDNSECVQAWWEDPPEETTMGFPVIREPHPFERWREGIRIKKSNSEEYPWIQDFKSEYDIVIVGGGLVGSMIAYMLYKKIDISTGPKIAIIEKDPSYRYGLSTTSISGLRMQHSLPETIESSLFGSDFLRNATREISIIGTEEDEEDFLNVPNIKFQPHGHLTLAPEDKMEDLKKSHEIQKALGVQSAILSVKQLNKKFPWLNTTNIEGAILGLESEGWMDNWSLLQALKLKNIHSGVDYINGEVIYIRKHSLPDVPKGLPGIDRYEDGSKVEFGCPVECHVLLPEIKMVYPIQFGFCVIAAGGESGNIGRLAGIGEGTGQLSVEIPVKRQRQYVYQVNSASGPGLNLPITSDPSGLFIRRDGHCGDYLVGIYPSEDVDIPVNMWGDVDPSYWDEVVLPLLQSRVAGFENPTVKGSYPMDFDYNYYDGCPIVGKHPLMTNMYMACGFNGMGPMMAPAVGRGIMELIFDHEYTTIDMSRFAFDRILTGATLKEHTQFYSSRN